MSRATSPDSTPGVRAVLFDTQAPDREIDASELDAMAPAAAQLLWVDVEGTDVDAAMEAVLSLAARLGLQDAERAVREALDGKPRLRNHDD